MLIVEDIIWWFFQLLIGVNLFLPIVFYLAYQLRGRKKAIALGNADRSYTFDYAIIVTAYEQTALLPAVVNSLLNLRYENYLIYVVADKCDLSSVQFADDRVIVLRPEVVLANNVKSHFYAIDRFVRKHDILTIIDSDNLVDPNYLTELNAYFQMGFKAVQGVRKAKNLDTTYACLDAARDLYYHFYDGKLLFNLGSSATLAGSGMAFEVALYKSALSSLEIEGAGFDKVLQYELVKNNHRIAFAEDAIVYDEKTSRSDQLVKQRARWINTWFKYFYFGFKLLVSSVKQQSSNQFLFGMVLLRPPLFLFLLAGMLCLGIHLLLGNFFEAGFWLSGFIVFTIGFFVALKQAQANPKIYSALKGIPAFIFYQLKSLFYVKKANKVSVATEHYHQEQSDENN